VRTEDEKAERAKKVEESGGAISIGRNLGDLEKTVNQQILGIDRNERVFKKRTKVGGGRKPGQ